MMYIVCLVFLAANLVAGQATGPSPDVWADVKATVDNYANIPNMVLWLGRNNEELLVYPKGALRMITISKVATAQQ